MNDVNGNGNGRDLRMLEGVIANLPLFRQVAPAHIAAVASSSRTQQDRKSVV